MIRRFVRFARMRPPGNKTMVITHSAIIPPDYASSTEATQALLTAIELPELRADRRRSERGELASGAR